MIIDLGLNPFQDRPRIHELIDSIFIIILAISLWNWKRLGAYGFGATGLIGIIYAVYDPSSQTTFLIMALMVQLGIYFIIFIWKKKRLVMQKFRRGHAASRK